MPIRIQCPTCQASLSMPETMYGKAVRCPSCQNAFQCPPAPAGAPAPAARAPAPARRKVTPARPAPVDHAPFALAPEAAPALVPDQFDYDRGYRARRPTGWDKVRSGIVFLYFSTLCFFLLMALQFAVAMRDIEVTSESTLKVLALVGSLLLLVGAVLASIGQGFCCGVPYESGAKGAITGSTVFMIVATLGISVVTVFGLKETFSKETPQEKLDRMMKESKEPDLVKPIINLTTVGALFASVILLFFFLTLTAVHLRQWVLVKSIMGYCVVMPLAPLALVMLGYFQLAAAQSHMAPEPPVSRGVYKALLYGMVVLGALWFVLLLAGLRSGTGRASRRAA